MGSPFRSELPEIRDEAELSSRAYPYVMPVSRPPERVWRHVVLFLLTVATTTLVGADRYASFYLGFRTAVELPFSFWELIVRGLWYSVSILAILGAHEFGHYYACRYYGVDASLPYFLPVPPIVLSGTLGAFIRIRQQIPDQASALRHRYRRTAGRIRRPRPGSDDRDVHVPGRADAERLRRHAVRAG